MCSLLSFYRIEQHGRYAIFIYFSVVDDKCESLLALLGGSVYKIMHRVEVMIASIYNSSDYLFSVLSSC